MKWLTGRSEKGEPVLRDQIFRHARGEGNFPFFPLQLTTRGMGIFARFVPHLLEECDHTHANVSSEVFVTAEEPRSDLLYYRDIRYKKLSRIVSTTEGPDFEGVRNITLNTYCGDR